MIEVTTYPCPYCNGTGHVSRQTCAAYYLRQLGDGFCWRCGGSGNSISVALSVDPVKVDSVDSTPGRVRRRVTRWQSLTSHHRLTTKTPAM